MTDAQPIDSQPTDTTPSADAPPKPRLWPAAVILALMWAALTIPNALFPESPRAFKPMMIGLQLSFLLAVIWWLLASRTPIRDRLVGFGVFAGGLAAGLLGGFHKSVGLFPILFYVLPWLLTAVLVTLLVSSPLGWGRGRYAGLAALLLGLAAAAMIRTGQIDSGFRAVITPRWQSSSEEKLLASLAASDRESPPAEAAGAEETSNTFYEPGPTDWPGFRGAARDGHVAGGSLAGDWTTSPPTELWRRPIGPGWGSFCVVAGLAYTQEQRGDEECVVAYDAATGEPVWIARVEDRFEESIAGAGPRATPTYFEGSLFTVGAGGAVQKLDAATGGIEWSRDLLKDTGLENPPVWGCASSPLLVTPETGTSLAIVYACDFQQQEQGKGWVVAYDATSGQVAWKAPSGYHSYSSPHLAVFDGEPQVLFASNTGLESLDPASGDRLWRFEWDMKEFGRSTQPLVVDNSTVVLAAGYDAGTNVLDISQGPDGWSAKERWPQPSHALEPYFNDTVLHGGYLFGFHKKFLVSIDLETGEPTWPRRVKRKSQFGNGQLVLDPDSGRLLVTNETTGEVMLIEANPETLVVLATLQALEPNTAWNHPVVAGGRLFVRNGVEAVCYALPAAESPGQ